jgi:hypothetical protein
MAEFLRGRFSRTGRSLSWLQLIVQSAALQAAVLTSVAIVEVGLVVNLGCRLVRMLERTVEIFEML